jgi:hypothetical protein
LGGPIGRCSERCDREEGKEGRKEEGRKREVERMMEADFVYGVR